MSIQPPAVAGTFYPDAAESLKSMVEGLVATQAKGSADQPKALILPHAGYRFSGAVAAAGAARIKPGVTRVVILGPSHFHSFEGVALPDADALSTPLGAIPLCRSANALINHPDVHVVPEAYTREHSIEVELPFLQTCLGEFSVLPLIVGDISPDSLMEIIDVLWGGPETLIVISTDLTHFLSAEKAGPIDAATAAKVELMVPDGLTGREACGVRPLGAFLALAAKRGLRVSRLALTHSGVVTGDMSRVVGYGAWMAHEPEAACLSPSEREMALTLARTALIQRSKSGEEPDIRGSYPAPLLGQGASFITLEIEGRLRGCIGTLRAHRSLKDDIIRNAVAAGFTDPRFPPVTLEEALACSIEIAVLSRPAPLQFASEADLLAMLRPGRDGLILASGTSKGTFLPKVWDNLPTPEAFLQGLKRKADLPADYWSPNIKVWRYVAESFS